VESSNASSDGLVLKTNGLEMFDSPDVRRVRTRDRDSLRNGTLVGLAIAGGIGTAWCIGARAHDSGDINAGVECAEGFTVFSGLGALVGLAVDALIPGKVCVMYQAPPRQESSGARVTAMPLFARGTRGLTLAFAF
jgi:hypothetical protein